MLAEAVHPPPPPGGTHPPAVSWPLPVDIPLLVIPQGCWVDHIIGLTVEGAVVEAWVAGEVVVAKLVSADFSGECGLLLADFRADGLVAGEDEEEEEVGLWMSSSSRLSFVVRGLSPIYKIKNIISNACFLPHRFRGGNPDGKSIAEALDWKRKDSRRIANG